MTKLVMGWPGPQGVIWGKEDGIGPEEKCGERAPSARGTADGRKDWMVGEMNDDTFEVDIICVRTYPTAVNTRQWSVPRRTVSILDITITSSNEGSLALALPISIPPVTVLWPGGPLPTSPPAPSSPAVIVSARSPMGAQESYWEPLGPYLRLEPAQTCSRAQG